VVSKTSLVLVANHLAFQLLRSFAKYRLNLQRMECQ
jgi:hypothetical protein